MNLQLIWFILFGVLLIGYAILDGFDLGIGILHLFGRDDNERRIQINAIAPVWDGNEVWLLTGGGALFAAFPLAYATLFSSFYLALVLVLVGLIFRAVSMEFRSKVDSPAWRKVWDIAFSLGSFLPALLYGVAVGNILRGIPLDATHTFKGAFLGLLNPFALICGLVGLAMFTMHGAIYLCMKTNGEIRKRAEKWITRGWIAFVLLLVVAVSGAFVFANHLFAGALKKPLFFLSLLLILGGTVGVPIAAKAQKFRQAFIASATAIGAILLFGGTCLYPRIVPSTIDLANSITVQNASSSQRTLTAMLVIALIGLPFVIGYTIFIYSIFKDKTTLNTDSY